MVAVETIRKARVLAALLLGGLLCLQPIVASAAGSREEAAQEALARHGGKVLSISEAETREGQRQYIVKILSNGRMRLVRIRRDD